MLTEVADGVLVHQSEFLQSNATFARGLLIDPGLTAAEMSCLADDLDDAVVAGFSTHPDWDHLVWHPRFGDVPRYATARCAAAVEEQLSDPDLKTKVAEHLEETEIAGQVPLDLYGLITALPVGATEVPGDGPRVRIIEHQAHAPGHAALFIEESGVLVAGDMLSDILVPMLDLDSADPIEDYLAALKLLEDVPARVVIPGHGSVGGLPDRVERDRAYVQALRDGKEPDDPRIGPSAPAGWEWVTDLHNGQAHRLATR